MRYRVWRGPYASPWLTFYIGYMWDGKRITLRLDNLPLLAESGLKLFTENNLSLLTDGP